MRAPKTLSGVSLYVRVMQRTFNNFSASRCPRTDFVQHQGDAKIKVHVMNNGHLIKGTERVHPVSKTVAMLAPAQQRQSLLSVPARADGGTSSRPALEIFAKMKPFRHVIPVTSHYYFRNDLVLLNSINSTSYATPVLLPREPCLVPSSSALR